MEYGILLKNMKKYDQSLVLFQKINSTDWAKPSSFYYEFAEVLNFNMVKHGAKKCYLKCL